QYGGVTYEGGTDDAALRIGHIVALVTAKTTHHASTKATSEAAPSHVAGNTCQVFHGKVLLVDVIGKPYQGNSSVSAQHGNITSGRIFIVGTVTGIHTAKLSVSHIGAGYH